MSGFFGIITKSAEEPEFGDRWLRESPAPKLRTVFAVGRSRKHSPAFKAKVVLEALEDQETVAQLAARYEVHSGQIQAWKTALTEGASGVFGNGKDQKSWNDSAPPGRLGQLKAERDFLAKRSGP